MSNLSYLSSRPIWAAESDRPATFRAALSTCHSASREKMEVALSGMHGAAPISSDRRRFGYASPVPGGTLSAFLGVSESGTCMAGAGGQSNAGQALNSASRARYQSALLSDLDAVQLAAPAGQSNSVRYPGPIPRALKPASPGPGKLDLDAVTSQMLAELSAEEHRALVRTLSQITIRRYFSGTGGGLLMGTGGHSESVNAMVYLLDRIANQKTTSGSTVARLVADLPESTPISKVVAEKTGSALPELLKRMKGQSKGPLDSRHARVIANFAETFTKGRGGEERMRQLLQLVGPAISQAGLGADDAGLVVGALLAGFRSAGTKLSASTLAGLLSDSLALIPGIGKIAQVALKAGLRVAGCESFGSDRVGDTNRLKGAIKHELLKLRQTGELSRDDEEKILDGIERGLNHNGY